MSKQLFTWAFRKARNANPRTMNLVPEGVQCLASRDATSPLMVVTREGDSIYSVTPSGGGEPEVWGKGTASRWICHRILDKNSANTPSCLSDLTVFRVALDQNGDFLWYDENNIAWMCHVASDVGIVDKCDIRTATNNAIKIKEVTGLEAYRVEIPHL